MGKAIEALMKRKKDHQIEFDDAMERLNKSIMESDQMLNEFNLDLLKQNQELLDRAQNN